MDSMDKHKNILSTIMIRLSIGVFVQTRYPKYPAVKIAITVYIAKQRTVHQHSHLGHFNTGQSFAFLIARVSLSILSLKSFID